MVEGFEYWVQYWGRHERVFLTIRRRWIIVSGDSERQWTTAVFNSECKNSAANVSSATL